jgi:2-polyprenyl-6-methoxyphenol hydroxylase-like FAD-dependent oxidoreductase
VNGSAIVVGGGIGGLAAAVALRHIGWQVTVLERAPALGEIGAGMSQAPNALRALDALGLGARAREVGVPFHGTNNLRTPTGDYLIRSRTPADSISPLIGFHRADLHRVLLDAVPGDCVHAGTEATGIEQPEGSSTVTVTCENEELTADLVVAADGGRSTARRLLWPDAPEPRFWKNTIWRGIATMDGIEASVTMGRGEEFLIMPVGRGRIYWAMGALAPRPGVRADDELAEVRRRVGSWHDPIPALLDATPPAAVLHHDMFDLDSLPTYVRGHVALLGDAAHLMHPHLGQGAGQAIEDAVVLAAALAESADIPAALAHYDDVRRPRTQRIVKQARGKSPAATSRNPLSFLLGRLMLRMIPDARWPSLSERGLAPLWDWTPPRLPHGSPRTDV